MFFMDKIHCSYGIFVFFLKNLDKIVHSTMAEIFQLDFSMVLARKGALYIVRTPLPFKREGE